MTARTVDRNGSGGTALQGPDRELLACARSAAARAYAPYSGFAVGAAVRRRTGEIIAGANFENASYGLSICAEATALAAASAAGARDVTDIAVVAFRFLPEFEATPPVAPCGRCRQLIAEAAMVSGVDVLVHTADAELERASAVPISRSLPGAFAPDQLGEGAGDRSKAHEKLQEIASRFGAAWFDP